VDLAEHHWVLLLDADEAINEALQTELLQLKQTTLIQPGYRLMRREWLAWKTPIEKHGRWQHRWVKRTDHLRLFDRRIVHLSDHPVHAAPFSTLPTPALKNDLLHWGDAPFSYRRDKARRYAKMQAQPMIHKAAWMIYTKCLFAPIWAFIQDYWIRRGFMNPALGLVAALHSGYASYLKYKDQLKR